MNIAIEPARREDVDAVAYVHWRGWQDTYRGHMPDGLLDNTTLALRLSQWRGPWFEQAEPLGMPLVARLGGEVVGIALAKPARDIAGLGVQGELLLLYVLQEAQGQGVGQALFQATCRWFREHGLASFGLWVVETNAGARRFYERQGGVAAETRSEILRGERIDEIAYLWRQVPEV